MVTLARFSVVALPVGWLLLTTPVLTGLPAEPFVLATLVAGLLLPALVLARGDPGGTRALLREVVRRPRSWWLVVPAAALIPGFTWVGAYLVGAVPDQVTPLALAVNISSGLLIVNLWEELVWTGFVQRRAMTRWGTIGGSLVTAALFAGLHLPLTLDGDRLLAGLAALAVAGVAMRLLIAAGESWSGGSLLIAALLHASFNAAALVVAPTHDWVRYAVTLALALPLIAALRRHADAATTVDTGPVAPVGVREPAHP